MLPEHQTRSLDGSCFVWVVGLHGKGLSTLLDVPNRGLYWPWAMLCERVTFSNTHAYQLLVGFDMRMRGFVPTCSCLRGTKPQHLQARAGDPTGDFQCDVTSIHGYCHRMG